MTTIINSINSGFNVGDASFCLESMIEKYADDGENTVILGCTELALYPEKNKSYTINSINVLVEMVIERLCLHPSPTKSESPISH
jgi:aspartate/glutamate racemase